MPGLRNRAILEIDLRDSNDDLHTGVFELREDLSDTGEVTKQFLLSNRGQYIREAYDIGTDILPDDVAEADLEDRKGYHVDGGTGMYTESLDFTAGSQDAQWGDGSTDPDDPSDLNKYDATGADPTALKQVLEWYVSQARTGSGGPARLHIGEWTDGTYSDSAGVFDRPMPVAIKETNITKDPDDPSAIEGTIELAWTAVFPDVDVQGTIDEAAELVPDF